MSDLAFHRSPLNDLGIVQNPGLGAFAVWRFGQGFQSDDERPAHFALAFLVLPIVFHRPSLDTVLSTNKSSGLTLFVSKIGHQREQLLAIHERVLLLRNLTLQSVAVGINGGLLTLNYHNGALRSNEIEMKTKKLIIPDRIKAIGAASERVGYWFSRFSIEQVTNMLGVQF